MTLAGEDDEQVTEPGSIEATFQFHLAFISAACCRGRFLARTVLARVYASGKEKENTDPPSDPATTWIAPPWASTMAFAMGSPMPVPCT